MGSDLTFTVRAGNNGRPWLEGHRRDPYVLCGLYLDDLGGDERRGKDLLIERYAPPMMEQPDQTSIWIVTFGLTTTQLAEQYLKDGSARLRRSPPDPHRGIRRAGGQPVPRLRRSMQPVRDGLPEPGEPGLWHRTVQFADAFTGSEAGPLGG